MGKVERVAAMMAGAGILIASAAYAYQHVAPYLSEDSCIIEGVTQTGNAGSAAVLACRERYESKVSDSQEEVPRFMAKKIDGKASFGRGVLSASLYNGGSHYTITRIRVGVTDPATADLEEPVTRYYDVAVNIPPLSARDAQFQVFEEYESVNWHIAKAWGVDKS